MSIQGVEPAQPFFIAAHSPTAPSGRAVLKLPSKIYENLQKWTLQGDWKLATKIHEFFSGSAYLKRITKVQTFWQYFCNYPNLIKLDQLMNTVKIDNLNNLCFVQNYPQR